MMSWVFHVITSYYGAPPPRAAAGLHYLRGPRPGRGFSRLEPEGRGPPRHQSCPRHRLARVRRAAAWLHSPRRSRAAARPAEAQASLSACSSRSRSGTSAQAGPALLLPGAPRDLAQGGERLARGLAGQRPVASVAPAAYRRLTRKEPRLAPISPPVEPGGHGPARRRRQRRPTGDFGASGASCGRRRTAPP